MNQKVYLLLFLLLAIAASQKLSADVELTEKTMREDWASV